MAKLSMLNNSPSRAAAPLAFALVPLSAAQSQTTEIRFASSSPPNTVWAMQTERLAKMISEKSGGAAKVNAFINSQLGSEQDTIQQVARGRIDMGGVTIINKAVYDKLSPAVRKAFDDTNSEVPAAQLRKEVREFETKLPIMHKSQGGTIVELSAEQREVWRQQMTAAWPKMVEAIGGESNAMWRAIQDGMKACAK